MPLTKNSLLTTDNTLNYLYEKENARNLNGSLQFITRNNNNKIRL